MNKLEDLYTQNKFVLACAEADMDKVKAFIRDGEYINQLEHPDSCRVLQQDRSLFAALNLSEALGLRKQTRSLTGLGAAIKYHQLDVLKYLFENGVDTNKARLLIDGSMIFNAGDDFEARFDNAVNHCVQHSFIAGLDYLVAQGIALKPGPNWAGKARSKDELLFNALPISNEIRISRYSCPEEFIEQAQEVEKQKVQLALAMFDHLLNQYQLDINARNVFGDTLISHISVLCADILDDDPDIILRHALKRGASPQLEKGENKSGVKIVFTEEAEQDLLELMGIDLESDDPTELDFTERMALYESFSTPPLIKACYNGDVEQVNLLLAHPDSDPLKTDINGRNCFVATKVGAKINAAEKGTACYKQIEKSLKAKVQKTKGANLLPFAPKPK
jgi:hypothetical protein